MRKTNNVGGAMNNTGKHHRRQPQVLVLRPGDRVLIVCRSNRRKNNTPPA